MRALRGHTSRILSLPSLASLVRQPGSSPCKRWMGALHTGERALHSDLPHPGHPRDLHPGPPTPGRTKDQVPTVSGCCPRVFKDRLVMYLEIDGRSWLQSSKIIPKNPYRRYHLHTYQYLGLLTKRAVYGLALIYAWPRDLMPLILGTLHHCSQDLPLMTTTCHGLRAKSILYLCNHRESESNICSCMFNFVQPLHAMHPTIVPVVTFVLEHYLIDLCNLIEEAGTLVTLRIIAAGRPIPSHREVHSTISGPSPYWHSSNPVQGV